MTKVDQFPQNSVCLAQLQRQHVVLIAEKYLINSLGSVFSTILSVSCLFVSARDCFGMFLFDENIFVKTLQSASNMRGKNKPKCILCDKRRKQRSATCCVFLFYFCHYHYIAGSGPLQWMSKSFVHYYLSNGMVARWLLTR